MNPAELRAVCAIPAAGSREGTGQALVTQDSEEKLNPITEQDPPQPPALLASVASPGIPSGGRLLL